jgi:protein SCO1
MTTAEMPGMTRRTWLTLAAVAGAIAGGLSSREAVSEGPSARDRIREQHLPNVELITHEGKKVRFYDDLVKDKIVVINFMYTECADGTCPITSANLARVQKLLGRGRMGHDIFFCSITLTPRHDTPAVLKKYAKAYGAGPGWIFLTGNEQNIELLRRKLGFTDLDPKLDGDKASHIGNIRYGNEALQLWAACPGNASAAYIAKQISWVDWPEPGETS